MRALRFNHVSVHADDLEESARFYEHLFGMERLPTPTFADVEVLWLRLGDQQLHLFRRGVSAPAYHHFALEVDDFEAAYERARERGLLETEAFGAAVRELPDGAVQMYLRDPAGNLVEIDWPDVSTLAPSVATGLRRLADEVPQPEEGGVPTLFLRSAHMA